MGKCGFEVNICDQLDLQIQLSGCGAMWLESGARGTSKEPLLMWSCA